MEKDYYIKGWLEGTLTEEERREFESSEDYKMLVKLSKYSMDFKAPEFNTEKELQRFKNNRPAKSKSVRINWLKPLLRIAAAVVFIISGYFLFFNDTVTSIQTASNEKTQLELPDASLVVLNAQSEISYNKNKWSKHRSLALYGEAYFKVAKGSRFEVKTSSGLVTVLGTQFNVKNRVNYFEVICYEGLVNVQSQDRTFELPANKMLQLINGVLVEEKIPEDDSPSWVKNESSFQSVPFKEVIEEFERQYDVVINTHDVDLGLLFTGRFVHADLDLALRSICFPLNLTYQITDDHHIVLSGEIE